MVLEAKRHLRAMSARDSQRGTGGQRLPPTSDLARKWHDWDPTHVIVHKITLAHSCACFAKCVWALLASIGSLVSRLVDSGNDGTEAGQAACIEQLAYLEPNRKICGGFLRVPFLGWSTGRANKKTAESIGRRAQKNNNLKQRTTSDAFSSARPPHVA